MIILLFFAFLSGLITIFAPCIWPILPIVLASTTTGGHRKPLGITIGICVSFGLLTLFLSFLIKLLPIDPNAIRYLAVIVIGFLGIVLIVPALSQMLEGYVSKLSGKIGLHAGEKNSGFLGGLITGGAIGIIWTPCAGPILATIATLAATQQVSVATILVTIVYVTGIGIPLFAFATYGRKLFATSKKLSKYTGRIQQVFGIIMLLTALLIATNYDKLLEANLLNLLPSYSNLLTNIESIPVVTQQLNELKNQQVSQNSLQGTSSLFNANFPAPDVVGITKWLNLPAGKQTLSINDLKGKVVLVDFWTYTCINCIRTLPHVTSWYEKYKDQGFVVIGVHTPEFAFEHDTTNVENAIDMFHIHYPVPQDNNYATWNSFNNQYWPAEYLIDKNGIVRRTHFGEGEYSEMEMAIQALLKDAGKKVTSSLDNMPDQAPTGQISPETYLGSNRMQYYYPTANTGNGKRLFILSNDLTQDSFSFGGEWEVTPEAATSGENAVINYNFYADKVFLVLRPGQDKNNTVKVFLDGKSIDNARAGSDVNNGIVSIDSDRLYNLIDLRGKVGNHVLRLEFSPGIQAFAFTFG